MTAAVEQKRAKVNTRRPLIRAKSNGEMIAGFLDSVSGAFEEVMQIANERDIDAFVDMYDLTSIMISRL